MMQPQPTVEQAYVFVLERRQRECYYHHVEADFTPLRKQSQDEVILATPVFLMDRNYFTPTFVLPSSKRLYELYADREREKFDDRAIQSHQKQSRSCAHEEEPIVENCQICKVGIQNYYQHIKLKSHIRLLKASRANIYISELVVAVQKQTAEFLSSISRTRPIKKKPKESRPSRKRKNSCSSQRNAACKSTNNSTNLDSQNILKII